MNTMGITEFDEEIKRAETDAEKAKKDVEKAKKDVEKAKKDAKKAEIEIEKQKDLTDALNIAKNLYEKKLEEEKKLNETKDKLSEAMALIDTIKKNVSEAVINNIDYKAEENNTLEKSETETIIDNEENTIKPTEDSEIEDLNEVTEEKPKKPLISLNLKGIGLNKNTEEEKKAA